MSLLKGKKVLQVLPTLSAGGVEQTTLDIAKALVDQGAIAYVAASGGVRRDEVVACGGHFIPLALDRKNPLRMFLQNIWSLVRVIKAHKIDVVHARSRGPAWSAYRACRLTATPFVTTFHGTYNFHSLGKKFYNSSMVRGHYVIANSDFIKKHILTHYGAWVRPERVTKIYRGIDTRTYHQKAVSPERKEKMRALWRLCEHQKVFLMPGRLTRWKGQEVALKAMAKLAHPNVVLVIVGSDQGRHAYRQELQALTRELRLEKHVRFAEHCEDMPAAYAVAHCVLHASTDPEAFGRVVAEAQAMGLPCLVSDLGAPKEIILPQETGWLVPAGQEEKLAERMGDVLSLSPADLHVLAQKARQRVKEKFSLEEMRQKTLEVYAALLSQRHGP